MEQLLLVNPSPRPKRRGTRTAAQKRATAKMVAANRARRRTRRSNPVAPVSAPKYKRSTRRARKAVNTYARRSRARRRNPIGGVGEMLSGALIGATGALAVNAMFNYAPIPDTMKTGYAKHAVKGAFAVALGIFGKRFLGRRAVKAAEGSLTMTLAELLIQASAGTGMNLGYYSPAVQYMPSPAVSRRLSEYVSSNNAQMPSLADNYRQMGEYVS